MKWMHDHFMEVVIALFVVTLIVLILALADTLIGNQQNCERFNKGQTQRNMLAHRVLAPQLNCKLFFPQG